MRGWIAVVGLILMATGAALLLYQVISWNLAIGAAVFVLGCVFLHDALTGKKKAKSK